MCYNTIYSPKAAIDTANYMITFSLNFENRASGTYNDNRNESIITPCKLYQYTEGLDKFDRTLPDVEGITTLNVLSQ